MNLFALWMKIELSGIMVAVFRPSEWLTFNFWHDYLSKKTVFKQPSNLFRTYNTGLLKSQIFLEEVRIPVI